MLFSTETYVEEKGTIESVPANDVSQLNLSKEIEFVATAVVYILQIGFVVVMVGSVLYFLFLMLSGENDRFGIGESDSIDEREKMGGLQRAFNNRFKRLADALGLLRNFGLGRGLVGALTIRWAYTRMEHEAKKRGYPRYKSQIPYEYRLDCYRAYPDCNAEIKLLTEAYVAIRYGELPESDEDLDQVRQALDKVMASKLVQE